jgi:hypothetical protein
MLQYRTIEPGTLELLKKLMQVAVLQDFHLAGGSGLALQLGHRFSYDLDLFPQKDFDTDIVLNELHSFKNLKILGKRQNTLNLKINGIKVDFISYKYKLINEIVEEDGIRLYSVEDIAAMKLSAISNRGIKRDFYDLYYILKRYSINDLLGFFGIKFPSVEIYHLLKSLTYFEDAENNPEPKLFEQVEWKEVKSQILQNIKSII